jgi:hypothetical protein
MPNPNNKSIMIQEKPRGKISRTNSDLSDYDKLFDADEKAFVNSKHLAIIKKSKRGNITEDVEGQSL